MRRLIGLLGGSFDPVHAGHLQLARDAIAQLGLDELRVLPAGQPWQKGTITDAAHRAHMVELALRDVPGAALDVREIARTGPTYTIDTLRELRAALGAEAALVWLLGADQFERLDTWRDWRSLLDHAHLAVAARAGADPQPGAALAQWWQAHRIGVVELRARPAGGIAAFAMTPVDASATALRTLLATPPTPTRDAQLAATVPPAVLDYICRHRLYGFTR